MRRLCIEMSTLLLSFPSPIPSFLLPNGLTATISPLVPGISFSSSFPSSFKSASPSSKNCEPEVGEGEGFSPLAFLLSLCDVLTTDKGGNGGCRSTNECPSLLLRSCLHSFKREESSKERKRDEFHKNTYVGMLCVSLQCNFSHKDLTFSAF